MSDLIYCPLYDIEKSEVAHISIFTVNYNSLPLGLTKNEFILFIKEISLYYGDIEIYYDLYSFKFQDIQVPIPDKPTDRNVISELQGAENIAYVKLNGIKHNYAHNKRSELEFEVIEWIHGGNGDAELTLYSSKHPEYAWGEIEYYSGVEYEDGKEYLIAYGSDNQIPLLYIPLEDITKAKYYNESAYDYLLSHGMEQELDIEGFIEYIKSMTSKAS